MRIGITRKNSHLREAVRVPCPICSSAMRYGSIRPHLRMVHGIHGRRMTELRNRLQGAVWSEWATATRSYH